jgi:hypothetical protein
MNGSSKHFVLAQPALELAVKVHTSGTFSLIVLLMKRRLFHSLIKSRAFSIALMSKSKYVDSKTFPLLNHLQTQASPALAPVAQGLSCASIRCDIA